MPRDLPLGNGNLLINFDANFYLCDLYYPYVGQENHTGGGRCRFGVWVDQHFSWVHDSEWTKTLRYEPDTLVSEVALRNARLGLHIVCSDAVDPHVDIFVRRLVVQDFFGRHRDVRLFFHFDAHLWGHNVGDSVYFDPRRRALVHYKGRRYVLLNGMTAGVRGLAAYSAGTKGIHGAEGTWRDAEDGRLSGHSVAQGSIDSTGMIEVAVEANSTANGYFWLAIGKSADDVHGLDTELLQRTPDQILQRTGDYWRRWVRRGNQSLAALPDEVSALYRRSFLILRTQIDNRGAILAANDGDCLQFGRDTYSYVWPRDGALVTHALIRGGYSETSQRFLAFCHEAISDEGYLLHKYNPDGSPGSSWHPWVDAAGNEELPIQEDETALTVWALWQHYAAFQDLEFVRPMFERLVRRPAEFMLSYRDPVTRLPLPSHDLWEERRGVHTFTVATVWAGLRAAATLCDVLGDSDLSKRCEQGAHELRTAVLKHMMSDDGRFLRALRPSSGGSYEPDLVVDASIAGSFLFGMFAADSPEVTASMRAIEERLWCPTWVGGIGRYEHDWFSRVTDAAPGNPWIVCTMWLASWYVANARNTEDMQRPLELLVWVTERAQASGVLAEQFHPLDGSPLSVAPLTWSHASFVSAVQDYVSKWEALSAAPVAARSHRTRGHG